MVVVIFEKYLQERLISRHSLSTDLSLGTEDLEKQFSRRAL